MLHDGIPESRLVLLTRSGHMGHVEEPNAFAGAIREFMDEIARIAPTLFGGVSYSRLDGDGLQWPCPDAGHPGTATVHADGFVRGRGRLMTLPYVPTVEQRSADYPLLLTTGRVLQHYNVGTMTRRSPHRALEDADYLEINPQDAAAAGVAGFVMHGSSPGLGEVRLRGRGQSGSAGMREVKR